MHGGQVARENCHGVLPGLSWCELAWDMESVIATQRRGSAASAMGDFLASVFWNGGVTCGELLLFGVVESQFMELQCQPRVVPPLHPVPCIPPRHAGVPLLHA